MGALTGGEPAQALPPPGHDTESERAGLLGKGDSGSEATAAQQPSWWRCWRYRLALTAALGEGIVYGQRIAVPIALVVMQAELNWQKETQGIVMTVRHPIWTEHHHGCPR